jgi:hypothetical protein
VSRRLLGRGAYVIVLDAAGRPFVSKRSAAKDCYPGLLDVTISGVVNYVSCWPAPWAPSLPAPDAPALCTPRACAVASAAPPAASPLCPPLP